MDSPILVGTTQPDRWHHVFHKTYPDGMSVLPDPTKYDSGVIDTMILRPRNLHEFVTGLFLVDAYEARGIDITHLILPFIPGARQDRLNDEGDFLFTVKSVAQMINARNFDRVTVADPHSLVAPALIERCQVYPMGEFWDYLFRDHHGVKVPHGYDAVIIPDLGASKRALDAAYQLGVPLVQAEKHRDVSTGKLSGFACPGAEMGKHYLVVDDICDGGGTFVGLAKVIQDAGATADLFVTHGIFSQGTSLLDEYYKRVITTDSTLFDKGTALVVPILGRLKRL